jgi:putative phosphoesterase
VKRGLDSSSPRNSAPRNVRIGVIADTHGLLRPEALEFLQGADHILHAGDIGGARILEDLRAIAELSAVRGNNDAGAWAASLPHSLAIDLGAVTIYLIHDRTELRVRPPPDGTCVVISGHSHRPLLESRDGRLFMNPGSAGRRRFKLPISIGEIRIETSSGETGARGAGAIEAGAIGAGAIEAGAIQARIIEARIIELASQAVLAHQRVREVGHTLIDSANLLI